MKSVAAFGLALLLAACSADAGKGTASDDAALETSSGWITFSSRADALAWFDQTQHAIGWVFPVLPDDAPQTLRAQAIIDAHWATIKAHYPIDIPPPTAIVADWPSRNAYAASDPQRQMAVDAVVIFSETFERDDDHLDAILAHELGHIVGRHAEPARGAAVDRYYRATTPEPLGLLQADDPSLHASMDAYRRDGDLAGPGPIAELDGVAYRGGYEKAFRSLPWTEGADDVCDALTDLKTRVGQLVWRGHYTELTASARAEVADAVQKIAANGCYHDADGLLVDTLAEGWGVSRDDVAQRFAPEDRALLATAPATREGVFALGRQLRSRLVSFAAAPAYSTLRWYSIEEEADDFGMTIRRLEGKDLGANARFLLRNEGADAEAACEATLARGEVPTYGLEEVHHSNCYRYFHAEAFAKWLEEGGAGVTPAQILGTSRRAAAGSTSNTIQD